MFQMLLKLLDSNLNNSVRQRARCNFPGFTTSLCLEVFTKEVDYATKEYLLKLGLETVNFKRI